MSGRKLQVDTFTRARGALGFPVSRTHPSAVVFHLESGSFSPILHVQF